jgi:hypothetical protein
MQNILQIAYYKCPNEMSSISVLPMTTNGAPKNTVCNGYEWTVGCCKLSLMSHCKAKIPDYI